MSATKRICLLAVLTATLTGGKMAIAIPNVEIVTLLFIVYALVFGWRNTIIVSVLFVLIEIMIWPPDPRWITLYFIHWPALVTATAFLPRKIGKFRIVAAVAIGIAFTAFFGVLSTTIDVVLMGGIGSGYFRPVFGFIYLAGVPLFITHIVSNSIILPTLVPMLSKALKRMAFVGNNSHTMKCVYMGTKNCRHCQDCHANRGVGGGSGV